MRRAVVAVAAAAAVLAASPASAPAATTRVAVPLDRSGAVPGTLRLHVERIPVPGPRSGVVLALVGGPGESASGARRELFSALRPGLGGRDLVLYDRRGTGRSGALRCPALERAAEVTPALGQACASELGARRGLFTTREDVQDLEAVRIALRARALTIYAASYGARLALAYAAAHPERVQRLVLDSPVAPEGVDPFRRPSFRAVGRVLRELCGGSGCRVGSDPAVRVDPAADVRELASRLRASPLSGPVVDETGRVRVRVVDEDDLFTLLLRGDMDPTLREELPAAVRAALEEDPAPLLRLFLRGARAVGGRELIGSFSPAAFAATSCEETSFPWSRDAGPQERASAAGAAAEALPAADVDPFSRAVALASPLVQLCAGWSNAAPAPSAIGPLPAVPALVLAGRGDLRAPLEEVGGLAPRLPASSSLPVPGAGHAPLLSERPVGCARREVRQFLSGRTLAACPARRPVGTVPRFARTSEGMRPAAGLRGTPAHVATAVLATIEDASRQLGYRTVVRGRTPAVAGGGLRGGRFRLRNGRLELREYRYASDVAMSMSAPRAPRPARVRVRFRGRTVGTLLLYARGELAGRLGGQRIRVRVASGPGLLAVFD